MRHSERSEEPHKQGKGFVFSFLVRCFASLNLTSGLLTCVILNAVKKPHKESKGFVFLFW
jgi:hypothetical protein